MSDANPSSALVPQLLREWTQGDEHARDAVVPFVYDELRRLATSYLNREAPGHTLQPTALVHEAYLRLIGQQQLDWNNRAQFLGLAATMMRRILVNHARDRHAAKRGGNAQRVPLSEVDVLSTPQNIDIIDLDDALERLGGFDARKAQLVELKFFGGLTTAEIAEVLHVSPATVERDWCFARAWLYDAIADKA
jgi:RNA polymerase sigma factor (TIGR02999 family)